MRRTSAAVVVMLGVFALPTSGGATTTTTDACGFLTRAEVTSALAEPLVKVQGGKSATGAVFCNWYGKDSHLFSKGVTLTAATDSVATRYKAYLSLMKKKTPIGGIGTAAVTDGTVVLARSSKSMVQIGPMYANSGVSLATVKALAKRALARADHV